MVKVAKRSLRRYGLVDLNTGEKYEAVITPWRSGTGGVWMKVFQEGKGRLLRQHPELRGESLRVLHYLEVAVKWGNLLPTPAEVGVGLAIQRPSAARAFAELLAAGFILKREGAYYLSPAVGWKGDERQLDAAYRQLAAEDQRVLPALAEGRGEYR